MDPEIPLRRLSSVHDTIPSFISLYAPLERGRPDERFLRQRVQECRRALSGHAEWAAAFEDSLGMLEGAIAGPAATARSIAVFTSARAGFTETVPLDVAVTPRLVADSSPYIRPLAELVDNYRKFAVVLLDQTRCTIVVSSLAGSVEADRVEGNIFHKHRMGGMSQRRFQRIHENRQTHYFKDVAEHLARAVKEEGVHGVVLAGPRVAKREFMAYLPPEVARLVTGMIDEDVDVPIAKVVREAFPLVAATEQAEEERFVERLQAEVLHDGLGCCGFEVVRDNLRDGRGEVLLVLDGCRLSGSKCEGCGWMAPTAKGEPAAACPACHTPALPVDLVEELIEIAEMKRTATHFLNVSAPLAAMGGYGLLLRYR